MFKRFNTIGPHEIGVALRVLERDPLSGFLGGNLRSSGYWIQRLESEWRDVFGVRHAIACNSATSGLLAACAAADVGPETSVVAPCYTMSATAAAPAMLGAHIIFGDVDSGIFGLSAVERFRREVGLAAIIVTNLFGHPAHLETWKTTTRQQRAILIEDNAQSPFAMENGRYAGTIGDIGVFSLNVHKHIQCGEGGVIVTNSDELATKMRMFINHGEMAGYDVGLNLRMTEITAAIACAQLAKGPMIIQDRIDQAEAILEATKGIPFIVPPMVRNDCKHVYYTIPWKVRGISRKKFVEDSGLPLVEGYVAPLYRLPAFAGFNQVCPVAETLHDETLFYFENCAWTLTKEQIREFGNAFHKAAESNHAHIWT